MILFLALAIKNTTKLETVSQELQYLNCILQTKDMILKKLHSFNTYPPNDG